MFEWYQDINRTRNESVLSTVFSALYRRVKANVCLESKYILMKCPNNRPIIGREWSSIWEQVAFSQAPFLFTPCLLIMTSLFTQSYSLLIVYPRAPRSLRSGLSCLLRVR